MFARRSRCRGDLWMPVWNAGRKPRIGRRIGQVIAVIDGVTCGNLVNLETRTAPLVVEHRTGPDRNALLELAEGSGL